MKEKAAVKKDWDINHLEKRRLGRERGQDWAFKAGKIHHIIPIMCLYIQAVHLALQKARGANTALMCPIAKGDLPRKLTGWPVIGQELA